MSLAGITNFDPRRRGNLSSPAPTRMQLPWHDPAFYGKGREAELLAAEREADDALRAVDPEFAAELGIPNPRAYMVPVTGELRRGSVPVLSNGVIVLRVPPAPPEEP